MKARWFYTCQMNKFLLNSKRTIPSMEAQILAVIPSDANPLSRTSSGIDKKFLQLFVLISIISQSKVSWQKHINTVTTARFQWGFT